MSYQALECRKCQMIFKNTESLNIHLKKFCIDSIYSDPIAFKQKTLNNSVQPIPLDFDEVRQYLKGKGNLTENSQISAFTLGEIRRQFQNDQTELDALKAQVLRKREFEKVEELRQLKLASKQTSLYNELEAAEIARLTSEMEAKRTAELNARLEKERVKKQLAEMDRKQLSVLSSEKRKELEELVKEREIVQMKEEAAMRQLEELEEKIRNETIDYQKSQEKTSELPTTNAIDEIRTKFELRAKELGAKSAMLQMEKSQLNQQQKEVSFSISNLLNKTEQFKNELNASDERPSSSLRSKFFAKVAQTTIEPNKRSEYISNLIAKQEEDKKKLQKLKESHVLDDLLAIENVENDLHNAIESDPALQDDNIKSALRNEDDELANMFNAANKSKDNALDDNISSHLSINTVNTPINNYIPTPSRIRKPSMVANAPNTPSNLPLLSNTNKHKRGGTVQFQDSMFNEIDSSIPIDLNKKPTIDSSELPDKLKSSVYSFSQNSNLNDNLQRELESLKLEFSRSGNSRPDIHQAIMQLEAEILSQQQLPNKSKFQNNYDNLSSGYFGNNPRQNVNPNQNFNPIDKFPPANTNQYSYPNQNFNSIDKFPPANTNQYGYSNQNPTTQNNQGQFQMQQQQYYPNQQYSYPQMQPLYPSQYGAFPTMPSPFDPSGFNNSNNPIFQQLSATQKLMQQQEEENKKLQIEMEALQRQKEQERWIEQRSGLDKTLQMFSKTLLKSQNPALSIVSDKLDGSLYSSVKDTYGYDESLRKLNQHSKDSELYRMELEHFTQLSKLRYEAELFEQKEKLQKLKNDAEKRRADEQRAIEHERYMLEQQQKLEASRLQQLLPVLNNANPQTLANNNAPAPISFYDPVSGFTVFIDHVSGLPAKVENIALNIQLFDNNVAKTKPRDTKAFLSELDPVLNKSKIRRCPIRFKRSFGKVSILPMLKIVVEILNVVSKDAEGKPTKSNSIAWTLFDIFTNNSLREGKWKVKLFRAPINKSYNLSNIRHPDYDIKGMHLYLRVVKTLEAEKESVDVDSSQLSQYKDIFDAIDGISGDNDDNVVTNEFNEEEKIVEEKEVELEIEPAPIIKQETLLFSNAELQEKLGLDAESPNIDIESALYNEKNGIGVMIVKMEHAPIKPFSRVRTILYADDKPMLNWETSHEKIGGTGILGVTEWQQQRIFASKPGTQFRFVFEVLEMKQPPDPSILKNLAKYEEVVGWTCVDAFKLHENQLMINMGTFNLRLYKLPISVSSLLSGDSFFANDNVLSICIYDPEKAPNSRRMKSVNVANSVELPFILNDIGPPTDKPFELTDGFDLYVDGARFLPDNVTITRIFAHLSDVNIEDLGCYQLSNVNGNIYSPQYSLRHEYRGEYFSPNSLINFRIDTVDLYSNSFRLVGVCSLDLFCQRGSRNPPTANSKEYFLNDGCFQLPLFFAKDGEKGINKLVKLPCATLLVRLVKAPRTADKLRVLSINEDIAPPESEWEALGLVVAPPAYSDGAYDSTRCNPTSSENKLYNKRKLRKDILVADIIPKILRPTESLDSIKSPEDLENYVHSRLVFPEEISILESLWIDSVRLSTFSPEIGFSISIDFGTQFDLDSYPSPPGNYYSQYRITDDAYFTSPPDVESIIKYPSWNNGFQNFKDVQPNKYSALILDFRLIDPDSINSTKMKPFAWTVFPIFTEDGFINGGMYQLPLYSGPFPTEFLPELGSQNCHELITKKRLSRKENIEFKEFSSIFIRVVDEQQHEIVPDFNHAEAHLKYLPLENRSEYRYNESEASKSSFFGFGSKPKKFNSFINFDGGDTSQNINKWRRDIGKKIQTLTGIKSLT